jgi:[ribosomal protein S18]-alanine N-acetyltransferase
LLATNTITYQEIPLPQLADKKLQTKLIKFLHQELGQYRDPEEDIQACLDYILNPAQGGHVFLAQDEAEIAGVVFVTKTNMHKFVPGYLLVYIATGENRRGQGIGKGLLTLVQTTLGSAIALHVEHDNPARKLYERVGFTSKYAEMRWYP